MDISWQPRIRKRRPPTEGSLDSALFQQWHGMPSPHPGQPMYIPNPGWAWERWRKPSGKRWSSIQCFGTRLSSGDSDTGQRTSLSNQESTDLLMNAVRTLVSGDWHNQPGVREGDQLWCPLSRRFKKQTGVRQRGREKTAIRRRKQHRQTLSDGRVEQRRRPPLRQWLDFSSFKSKQLYLKFPRLSAEKVKRKLSWTTFISY